MSGAVFFTFRLSFPTAQPQGRAQSTCAEYANQMRQG